MLLRAGQLNDEITLQRRIVVQDPDYGTNSGDWADFATVDAQVRDVLPSRAFDVEADGVLLTARRSRIRIRHIEGIDSGMRILFGERVLQMIAPPAELGRREGWEILAEDYSTEGTPP